MITIGVTGSIGSGKSTVSQMFHEVGAYIIDADLVARQIMAPFGREWWKICEYFGQGIIRSDTGEIDRDRLGAIVFGDFFLLQKLNSLVHPPIVQEIKDRLRTLRASGRRLAIVDAPLLIEAGLHKCVDMVVVVSVEPDIQAARLRNRNPRLTTPKIIQRISSQMSLEARKRYADFVIDNTGCLIKTRQQVLMIFQKAMNMEDMRRSKDHRKNSRFL